MMQETSWHLRRRTHVLLLGVVALSGLLLAACQPPAPDGAGDMMDDTEPPTAVAAETPAAAPEDEAEAEAVPDPEADPEAEDFAPQPGALVLYSGRSESLVGPLIEQYETETGAEVDVRWGKTAELAATLLEEGDNTPADVFFAQDPGGLGAVEPMLAALPDELLDAVDARFRDADGRWVGLSGRARTVVYNTERVAEDDLPDDLQALTDARWRGRIGWAPTNASFQTMVTAVRALWGEDEARAWLEAMQDNEPVVYEKNTPIVAAVGAGEVDLGLVNHYYLYRFLAEEGESFPARNHFLPAGGPGSLVMVAGAGVLDASERRPAAQALIDYLLSEPAQRYFATETYEYPLTAGVEPAAALPALDTLSHPEVDLERLADLEGTVALLREVGVLP